MKRSCLLFALLLSWIYATTAQTTDNLLKIAGLEPDLTGKTTYYLKNVGTGLYMSHGGEWGTHCIETQAAHPIIVEDKGDNLVAIGSIGGYLESNTLWMDSLKSKSNWKLVPVEGYTNQYYLVGDGDRVLTSVGNSAGLLSLNTLNNKAVQRWIFTNGADIKKSKMPNASEKVPFDVTVSIRGGAFDLVDGWEQKSNEKVPAGIKESTSIPDPYFGNWENYTANNKWIWNCGTRGWDPNEYAWCGIINGNDKALTVTYTMNLPKGTYYFSFEGFYKYMKVETKQDYFLGSPSGDPTTTTADNGKMEASVSIAGKSFALDSYGSDNSVYDNGEKAAAVFRDNDNYKKQGTFHLSSDQQVSIVLSKAATTQYSKNENTIIGTGTITTTSYPSQIYIDDFTLLYFGSNEVAESTIDPNAGFKNYINANVKEYKATLNEEGKAAFDEAFASVDVDNIKNRADYYNVIAAMESANDAGVVAHLKAEALKEAIATGNFTKAIVNNSFETGDLTGWTLGNYSTDTGVKSNSIEDYQTQGVDGSYLFNTWSKGVPITQTITGLPNGVYKMSVLIASGNEGNDATVYLLGNEEKKGVNPPSGGKVFGNFSLKFTVTNGTATIGVVGGADDDSAENPVGSYVEGGHWWYKADNFRLEYLGEDHLELYETASAIENINEPYKKVTIYRTIKPNTWSTFVVPFDMAKPAGWEVKTLTGSILNNENISLTFSDASSIEAGVPYMVRVKNETSTITATNVWLDTELKPTSTEHVEFIGTYTNGYVPTGAFFISGNTFYQAADESNTLKAFRAYLQPKVANARSLTYRTDEETTAIDNSQLTNDNEPTVIAIYNLQGVRLDDMQEGVNILQMSDGRVVKVIIK